MDVDVFLDSEFEDNDGFLETEGDPPPNPNTDPFLDSGVESEAFLDTCFELDPDAAEGARE